MTSNPLKNKELKKIELLEQLKLLENEEDELEPTTPIKNEDKETIENEKPEKPKKPKYIQKPRTEKQLEILAKGRGALKTKYEQGRQQKEENDRIRKQELEKKLIEKAIKIKKKQLKRIEVFDELSDEDTMPQEIQKPKQVKPKQVTQQPLQIINPYEVFKNKYNIH